MNQMTEYQFVERMATCHGEDCSNADIGVVVLVMETTIVQCGACGRIITDITDVEPATP